MLTATPAPCVTCTRVMRLTPSGECSACARYRWKYGVSRPYGVNDGRIVAPQRGLEHPMWKGDAAPSTTKRRRAQRRYPLGDCQGCGKPATDRHHRDGDTGHNHQSNISLLCRRCHMIVDGRLAKLVANAKAANPKQPAKPCSNCAVPSKPLRKGRCHACNEYWRRHQVERAPSLWG